MRGKTEKDEERRNGVSAYKREKYARREAFGPRSKVADDRKKEERIKRKRKMKRGV